MQRHHPAIIVLHWTVAALIALAVAAVLLHEAFENREWRKAFVDLHRSLGITVWLAVLARACLRFPLGAHRVNASLPPSWRLAALGGHAVLYVLMLALPVLGWLQTNAASRTVTYFWTFPLPSIVGGDRDLADTLHEWHETLAWLLLGIAAAHAAVALYHHYVRRDGVMTSMLPEAWQKRASTAG